MLIDNKRKYIIHTHTHTHTHTMWYGVTIPCFWVMTIQQNCYKLHCEVPLIFLSDFSKFSRLFLGIICTLCFMCLYCAECGKLWPSCSSKWQKIQLTSICGIQLSYIYSLNCVELLVFYYMQDLWNKSIWRETETLYIRETSSADTTASDVAVTMNNGCVEYCMGGEADKWESSCKRPESNEDHIKLGQTCNSTFALAISLP